MKTAVGELNWDALRAQLNEQGYAATRPVLTEKECVTLRESYHAADVAYRSTIDMARYNFGSGEYKYFAYPLPTLVCDLRDAFYRELAPIANAWEERLGKQPSWPSELDELTRRCHAAGQPRPTPLLLRYGAGDYNCLHQDLYGPIHFPLQVVIQLSKPGTDFDGGELVLVEQRPRMQSRPMVLQPQQGAATIVPVRERPRRGVRGYHRTAWRHGVSRIVRGDRYTLGLIFHDAA